MSDVKNVSSTGAILPQKISIDKTRDDNGRPGVALTLTLPTGDSMTFALSVEHAADLALGLARFLAGPDESRAEVR